MWTAPLKLFFSSPPFPCGFLLRSEMSCVLLSAVFNLFTWYCYLSAKSHKLGFMQDGYIHLISLYRAGIQSTNSGLLFMPYKMQRSGRKFYIPCLICLQKYSTIWYLNKNTPNQLKITVWGIFTRLSMERLYPNEEQRCHCWGGDHGLLPKVDNGVKWHR